MQVLTVETISRQTVWRTRCHHDEAAVDLAPLVAAMQLR
jgi:hypothetical protein